MMASSIENYEWIMKLSIETDSDESSPTTMNPIPTLSDSPIKSPALILEKTSAEKTQSQDPISNALPKGRRFL